MHYMILYITVEAITATQELGHHFRGAVFGPPHSKKACVELYCLVFISNRQLTGKISGGGGGPTRMRKGCRAHIQRKVAVRDDAAMASTLPPIHYNIYFSYQTTYIANVSRRGHKL
jgi:hypothetical protein